MLVIRRIFVTYQLRVAAEHASTARRVLAFHADHCPVARTLRGCVDISTHLEMLHPD